MFDPFGDSSKIPEVGVKKVFDPLGESKTKLDDKPTQDKPKVTDTKSALKTDQKLD